MRKCCCCGVKTGAVILGIYNLLLSVLVLVFLIGYLVDTDIHGLDVLNKGKEEMEKVLESFLDDHSWTKQYDNQIMESLKTHFPLTCKVATVVVSLSLVVSLFLIFGVRCKTRCLMLPWLCLSMLDILAFVAAGGIVVVALFYVDLISGFVALGVYIFLTVVVVYSWAVVLAAYRQLSRTEYIYSPAPVTPIYTNNPNNYYPSPRPQQFAMEEYRDLREEK